MRKSIFSFIILFTLLLAAAAPEPAAAQASGPADPQEMTAFIDGLVSGQLDSAKNHIAGATVAVVKDGQVWLAKGYGYADVAQGTPVSAETTLFRPGSISKLFTWTAVMQLVEQGKLSLDVDVNTYLDFTIPATYPQPITLANLLTHTPGFEDQGMGIMVASAEKLLPLREYLVNHMPQRVRPPGELAAYSNYGTSLAGYIVERVSGQPFEQYIEEHIFQPLGMAHATFHQPLPTDLAPLMSNGYTYANGAFVAQDFEYVQTGPAGALSATASDMARFMLAHLGGGEYNGARILQADTVQTMHTRHFTHAPNVSGWAYGFYELQANGQHGIGHGGDTQLFHSDLLLLPKQNLGVFVSYNSAGGSMITLEFIRAFMDHYFPSAPQPLPQSAAGAPAALQRYAGAYMSARSNFSTPEKLVALLSQASVAPTANGQVTISFGMPAALSAQYVETEPLVLTPLDPAASPFGRMVFRADAQGRITHMFMENFPTSAYIRMPWYAGASFNLALLGLCYAIFGLTIITGPVGALVNRRFGNRHRPLPRLARLLAWLFCLLGPLFMLLFIAQMNGPAIYGITPGLQAIMALPWLLALLALALVGFTILAWLGVGNPEPESKNRRPYWGWVGRIHYTLVTLAGLAYIWWLVYWKLLGF